MSSGKKMWRMQLAGDFLRRTVKEKAKADQKTFEKYLSGRTDYWYEKSILLIEIKSMQRLHTDEMAVLFPESMKKEHIVLFRLMNV